MTVLHMQPLSQTQYRLVVFVYVLVNVVTIYVFLYQTFWWPDQSIARFMWWVALLTHRELQGWCCDKRVQHSSAFRWKYKAHVKHENHTKRYVHVLICLKVDSLRTEDTNVKVTVAPSHLYWPQIHHDVGMMKIQPVSKAVDLLVQAMARDTHLMIIVISSGNEALSQ